MLENTSTLSLDEEIIIKQKIQSREINDPRGIDFISSEEKREENLEDSFLENIKSFIPNNFIIKE